MVKNYFIIVLILLIATSCSKNSDNINTSAYPESNGSTLALDLSTSPIEAKFIVNQLKSKTYYYNLPFTVSEPVNNIELYSTVGIYQKFTILSLMGDPSAGANHISFKPVINEYESSDVISKQPEDGLYIIKNGLERTFVYNYNYIKENKNYLQIKKKDSDTLSFIAVKLPLGAQGKEIENGKTTDPEPIISKNNIKIFPGTNDGLLKIKYELKSDLTAAKGFYLILKSAILIIVPVLEIFILFLITDRSKKRKTAIAFIILELVILFTMLVFGYFGEFIGFDLIIDHITTAILAVLASWIIYKEI